mmetsp:Transcript_35867/g.143344  ORF Transcript_35867/g.143344 Transcript_35867/m.143344 type:complete len:82 (+) Transcript_35867:1340-1585(+)
MDHFGTVRSDHQKHHHVEDLTQELRRTSLGPPTRCKATTDAPPLSPLHAAIQLDTLIAALETAIIALQEAVMFCARLPPRE